MTNNSGFQAHQGHSGHASEGKQFIPGIECNVTNCAYNDEKHNCFASKINVGGSSQARHEDETKCSTFECKPTDTQSAL